MCRHEWTIFATLKPVRKSTFYNNTPRKLSNGNIFSPHSYVSTTLASQSLKCRAPGMRSPRHPLSSDNVCSDQSKQLIHCWVFDQKAFFTGTNTMIPAKLLEQLDMLAVFFLLCPPISILFRRRFQGQAVEF